MTVILLALKSQTDLLSGSLALLAGRTVACDIRYLCPQHLKGSGTFWELSFLSEPTCSQPTRFHTSFHWILGSMAPLSGESHTPIQPPLPNPHHYLSLSLTHTHTHTHTHTQIKVFFECLLPYPFSSKGGKNSEANSLDIIHFVIVLWVRTKKYSD